MTCALSAEAVCASPSIRPSAMRRNSSTISPSFPVDTPLVEPHSRRNPSASRRRSRNSERKLTAVVAYAAELARLIPPLLLTAALRRSRLRLPALLLALLLALRLALPLLALLTC